MEQNTGTSSVSSASMQPLPDQTQLPSWLPSAAEPYTYNTNNFTLQQTRRAPTVSHPNMPNSTAAWTSPYLNATAEANLKKPTPAYLSPIQRPAPSEAPNDRGKIIDDDGQPSGKFIRDRLASALFSPYMGTADPSTMGQSSSSASQPACRVPQSMEPAIAMRPTLNPYAGSIDQLAAQAASRLGNTIFSPPTGFQKPPGQHARPIIDRQTSQDGVPMVCMGTIFFLR
jgi:hypothetical protein